MDLINEIQKLTAEIDARTAELNGLYIELEVLRGKPLDWLLKTVSVVCGVSVEDMKSDNQKREKVVARQVFCYVANELLNVHVSDIAKYINRNRTTVIYGIHVVAGLLSVKDAQTTRIINQIISYKHGNENSPLQPYLQDKQVI